MTMSRYVGTCTLPDGRTVYAVEYGTHEWDTNAFVPRGDMTVTDMDTEEELSSIALNTPITVDGQTMYLHEYISEHANWQVEDE